MNQLHSVDDLIACMGIRFSDEQIAAITAPMAPQVVIAGAGSGKTTVMAARVVWLVGRGLVAPDRVLGLTFTRKAAGELAARVRAGLARLDEEDERGAEVYTYDGFAARLVTEFGAWLGVGTTRIMTDAERFLLADQAVRSYPDPVVHLADKSLPSLAKDLLQLESRLLSHLTTDESVIADAERFLAGLDQAPLYRGIKPYRSVAEARSTVHERLELLGLCQHYRRLKARAGLVEFGDQMALAVDLAQQVPGLGPSLRSRHQLVVVDEFQDTSAAQARLLSRLFGTEAGVEGYPVTAVGDPLQAIYTWRGAAVDNIYSFHHFFPSVDRRTDHLSINRRSGPELLAAANAVAVEVRAGIGVHAQVLRASDEAARADLVVAEFTSWQEEADWIANDLAQAHDSGSLAWDQAAILVRRNSDTGAIFEACRRRGVPIAVNDLGGLLSIEVIAQVWAMMRLVTDVNANPEVVEILSGPRFRIGAADLARLGRRARELAAGSDPRLLDALLDPGPAPYSPWARGCLERLAGDYRYLSTQRGDLVDHVHRILTRIGADTEVYASQAGAAGHLRRFLALVAQFAANRPEGPLSALVAYLDAAEEYSHGLSKANPTPEQAVSLMTVHRAKGLEWQAVYLPDVVHRVFPDARLTDNPLTSPPGLPTAVRSDAQAMPQISQVTHQGLKAHAEDLRKALGLSEDRLAYVALTRAKQRLVVTAHRWADGLVKPRDRSRYLERAAAVATEVGQVSLSVDDGSGPPPSPVPVSAWPSGDDPRWRSSAEAVRRAGRGETTWSIDDPSPKVTEQLAQWDDLIGWLTQQGRPPEVVEVALPSPMSTSDLVRLEADPSGLARRLARPLPQAPSRQADRGAQFHAWVERYFSLSPIPQLMPEEDESSPIKVLCDQFLAGPLASARPVAVEHDFVTTIDGQVVSGRIDLVLRAQDNPGVVPAGKDILIIDWKTGRSVANPRQLSIYAQAWSDQTGVPIDRVAVGFYYVPDQRLVLADLGNEIAG